MDNEYYKLYKVTLSGWGSTTYRPRYTFNKEVYTIARNPNDAEYQAYKKIREMEYEGFTHTEKIEIIADEKDKTRLLTNQ